MVTVLNSERSFLYLFITVNTNQSDHATIKYFLNNISEAKVIDLYKNYLNGMNAIEIYNALIK